MNPGAHSGMGHGESPGELPPGDQIVSGTTDPKRPVAPAPTMLEPLMVPEGLNRPPRSALV